MARLTQVAPRASERNTEQRRIIRDVLNKADRPLSIEELLGASQDGRNAVSLSTVYRFVRSLVDDGTLTAFELPGQRVFYEIAGKAHHHHFSCTRCGRVYELDACVTPGDLALPTGFRAVSHEFTVTGSCATCNAEEVPRAVGSDHEDVSSKALPRL